MIGQQIPASFDAARGREPTMLRPRGTNPATHDDKRGAMQPTPAKARHGRIICHRECPACKELFPVTSDYPEKKYCNPSCAGKARAMPPRKCAYCGVMFPPINRRSKYCCPSCASSAQQRNKGRAGPPKICEICGKPIPSLGYRSNRKTCSNKCMRIVLSQKSARPRVNRIAFIPGTVLDKYGERHKLHEISAPFPLPVGPQWCPFEWQEVA